MIRTHLICDHCDVESYIVVADNETSAVTYCPFCGQPVIQNQPVLSSSDSSEESSDGYDE